MDIEALYCWTYSIKSSARCWLLAYSERQRLHRRTLLDASTFSGVELQRKLGVPAHVVDLLKAIYTGMTTRVCRQRGQLSTAFQMSTGVRQGSIEGPVLFLLYFAVVLKVWRKRCDDALGPNHGVPWQCVIDGTLRLPTHLRRCAAGTSLPQLFPRKLRLFWSKCSMAWTYHVWSSRN